MTRLKLLLLVLAVGVLSPAAAFAQVNVTGDWAVTVESPQGPVTLDATMKQEGEVLTGTITSPLGSVEFKGKVVNETIDVAYTMEMQGNSIAVTMTGKIAGDAIAGTFNLGGLGDVPWTAKRKAAVEGTAATAAPAAAATPAAGVADISGKWDITFNIAGNAMPASATLTQTGNKVTGTLSSQAGDTPVTGTITGQSLSLAFTAETPQGSLEITMTGEVGADGITGKMSLAGLGEADWTGKRSK